MDQGSFSGGGDAGATMPDVWHPPGFAAMMRADVSALDRPSDRFVCHLLSAIAGWQVKAIHGLEHVGPDRDPFILAFNHTTMREWALVPVLLIGLRGGRFIHFIADWNFQVVPGIGFIMRRGRVITVTHKDSWPKFLNRLKRFYADGRSARQQAADYLARGASIGIFPEGNVNRDPKVLLPGRTGAARLSLETGAPVVPAGIRFPNADPDKPIGENQAMEVHIGPPLRPPAATPAPPAADVRAWHLTIMSEIARLSAKSLPPSLAASDAGTATASVASPATDP